MNEKFVNPGLLGFCDSSVIPRRVPKNSIYGHKKSAKLDPFECEDASTDRARNINDDVAQEIMEVLDLVCMKGSIYSSDECPRHQVAFTGKPLHCPQPRCSARPQGPFHIEIYHAGELHKLYSGKTGETLESQKQAMKLLVQVNTEIAGKRFDANAYNKNRGRTPAAYLFRTYAERFMQDKELGADREQNAPSTIRLQRMYLTRHLYSRMADTDIRDISTATLKDLRRNLLEKSGHQRGGKPLSLKYVWNILHFVHSILAEAHRDGMIDKIPATPEIRLKKTRKKNILQHEAQLKVLRDLQANEPEHAPIFWTLYYTGHRPAEAAALRVRDYDPHKKLLDFARTYSDQEIKDGRKAGDEHLVPIPDELCAILDQVLEKRRTSKVTPHPDALLFVPPLVKKGRPALGYYRTSTMPRIWRRACERAGVPYIGLYNSTKHSLATRMLALGLPRSAIAALLGITEKSTHHYAEYEAEMLRPIVEQLHSQKPDEKGVDKTP